MPTTWRPRTSRSGQTWRMRNAHRYSTDLEHQRNKFPCKFQWAHCRMWPTTTTTTMMPKIYAKKKVNLSIRIYFCLRWTLPAIAAPAWPRLAAWKKNMLVFNKSVFKSAHNNELFRWAKSFGQAICSSKKKQKIIITKGSYFSSALFFRNCNW